MGRVGEGTGETQEEEVYKGADGGLQRASWEVMSSLL